MPHSFSRRQFLTAGASALAGVHQLGVGTPIAGALPVIIPTTRAARRRPPGAFLPEPPSPELFRRLALIAMDAAKAAGAEFADIRIGMQRGIQVPPLPYSPLASLEIGYGIRARVAGLWGFQYGNVLSAEAIVATAQSAVAGAHRYSATNRRLARTQEVVLAPAPVITGEWHGPNAVDPFTVPLDDYYRVIEALAQTRSPIYRNKLVAAGGKLSWQGETRIFASSDGSLVTQHLMRGEAPGHGVARLPDDIRDFVEIDLPNLGPVSAGFELMMNPRIIEYLETGLDEAVRLRELPVRPFLDVGRYPVVFDGPTFASLIGRTANLALDGDRVAGTESDASGDSFLVPPDEILNATTPQFSPLLTARVDRAVPSPAAVQWDDEGVTPEPYTIVDRGRVVDYHTTRATAPLLGDWSRRHGRPVRAHGVAVAVRPVSLPVCTGGHVHVAPASASTSVYELARDMQHGFIVRGGDFGTVPSLTIAMLSGTALEVRNGNIVARTHIAVQMPTKALLNDKLVALGGSDTVRMKMVELWKGVHREGIVQPVTAPAALCKDVDIVSRAF